MLVLRGAGTGALIASGLGTFGGAAVLIGASMAAMYVYDTYISPSSTSFPSTTPIAQVSIDGKSRPLTQVEKSAGFTNPTALGQAVTPPTLSVAYPPLWSGTGSVPNGGWPMTNFAACPAPVNSWGTSVSGANQYILVPSLGSLDALQTPGYEPASVISGTTVCIEGTTQYRQVSRARCALGYAGGTCALSSPSAVVLPVDGTCQIARSGNAYSINNKDPDCTPVAGKSSPIPVFTGSNGTISFISKPDSSGKPSVLTVDSSNGSTVVTSSIPSVEGDNFTNKTVRTTSVNPTTGEVTVTTVTTSLTSGVGPDASIAPIVVAGGASGPVNVDVDLPPNLAKTEDVLSVREAIENAVKGPDTPFEPDPGANMPPDMDSVTSAVGDGQSLPSVFSFGPTFPPSVEVPLITFSINGKLISLDISQWVGYIRNFLGVLLYVLMPFILFSILQGKQKEL